MCRRGLSVAASPSLVRNLHDRAPWLWRICLPATRASRCPSLECRRPRPASRLRGRARQGATRRRCHRRPV